MPEGSAGRAVSVVLHDVTPQSWPIYEPFVHAVDASAQIPLTLLVVPDFHARLHLDRHPDFRASIDRRIARGDEIALHGYYHHDDSPLSANPFDFLMRRVYTHEGEFYSLDEQRASERIRQGMELFRRFGWPVAGFVAPAWLMNRGTLCALRRFPLRYTSDMNGLVRLPDGRRLEAPSLVWSSGSAWRRAASRRWNGRRLQRTAASPLVRLGLHPVDMRHADAVRFWLSTLEQLLETRTARTKAQWLDNLAAG